MTEKTRDWIKEYWPIIATIVGPVIVAIVFYGSFTEKVKAYDSAVQEIPQIKTDVAVLKEVAKDSIQMKQDIRDIRNYLMGRK